MTFVEGQTIPAVPEEQPKAETVERLDQLFAWTQGFLSSRLKVISGLTNRETNPLALTQEDSAKERLKAQVAQFQDVIKEMMTVRELCWLLTHQQGEEGFSDQISALTQKLHQLPDAGQTYGGYRLDPANIAQVSKNEVEDLENKKDLTDLYLHDVFNPLSLIVMYGETLTDELSSSAPDQEFIVNRLIPPLQNAIEDSVWINSMFDLVNWSLAEKPILVSQLMKVIEKRRASLMLSTTDSETTLPFEQRPLTIEFSFEIQDGAVLDSLETQLDIPTFITLLNNVTQNTAKAYAVKNEAAPVENKVLRVQVKVTQTEITLIFEDDAIGFPQTPIQRLASKIPFLRAVIGQRHSKSQSGHTIELYQPIKGKTHWSREVLGQSVGKGIQGTGTGLAGFLTQVESVGGQLVTGTKLENGQRTGALIEVRMPVKSKASA